MSHLLGLRVETDQRVAVGSADPDIPLRIDVQRIGRLVLGVREVVELPLLGLWIEFSKVRLGYLEKIKRDPRKGKAAFKCGTPLMDKGFFDGWK